MVGFRPIFFRAWVLALGLLIGTPSWAIPVQGHRILVAGPSPYSPEIAREITDKGGNAIDVAVAIALGLSVTTPYYAALGGGGFALVRMNGKPVEVLDFREVAPKAATADLYRDKPKGSSMHGGLAIGVPGVPAGLWALHKKHGKLPWKQLFAPALKLARSGFMVSGEWVQLTARNKERFSIGGQSAFFKAGKESLRPGETLKQARFASALEKLSAQGPKGFYEGPVAKDIVKAVLASGGILTEDDLRSYQVRWLEPMKTQFLGHTLYLMPPPSSGGVVISSALKVIEEQNLPSRAPLSVEELHGFIEALKIGFRGRALLGDPEFARNPLEKLTSQTYLKEMSAKIKTDAATKIEPFKESEETTHFSVLDKDGNAVAFTVTLNGDYGSGVVSEAYGIALNNEMDDFTTVPGQPNMFGLVQGKANEIAPGKRPLSSMSPTLIEKDGRIVAAIGSPGGPRIISAVLQVAYRLLANGMDIDQAIQAPRVHHQLLPDVAYIDALRLSPSVLEALRKKGHKIEESRVAKVYGVRRNAEGLLEAAFDARGEGGAGGY